MNVQENFYSENQMELSGRNIKLNFKPGGTYKYHYHLQGYCSTETTPPFVLVSELLACLYCNYEFPKVTTNLSYSRRSNLSRCTLFKCHLYNTVQINMLPAPFITIKALARAMESTT